MPVAAESDWLPDEELVGSSTFDLNSSTDAGAIPGPENSAGEELPSVTYDTDIGGGVESFGGPPYSIFSEAATPVANPRLIRENESLSVIGPSGVYVVDYLRPESLMLLNHNGTVLVHESYFALKTARSYMLPANGSIIEASSDRLLLEYDLIDKNESQSVVASIQVTVDFTQPMSPKITAEVLDFSYDMKDWQVVWTLVPDKGSGLVLPEKEDTVFKLDQFTGFQVPTSSLSVEVVDSLSNSFMVNWTDANEGELYVTLRENLSGEEVTALEVAFGTGRAEIDPTLVATTTGTTPTELAMQRKVFWCGGYYWAFYYRGDKICYKRSTNGTSWSSEFELSDGTTVTTDQNGYTTGFDVSERDGVVAVVWLYKSTSPTALHLFFKKGTILGGRIVWSDRVEVYSPNKASSPSVTIATDGVFYVAALSRLKSNKQQFCVWYSITGSSWAVALARDTYRGTCAHWFVLMPYSHGRISLLMTWYKDGTLADTYAYASWGSSDGFEAPSLITSLGLSAGTKGSVFSAVATPDGAINAVLKDNTYNRPRYARISPELPTETCYISFYPINGYPAICLDENGDMHAYYLEIYDGIHVIWHSVMLGSGWTYPDAFYIAPYGVALKGLSSWVTPFGSNAMLWTENGNQVKFGSIPLPFGTPSAPAQPWNRDGISPYGTYFSSFQDLISPGSGLLTLSQQDVKVEGSGATIDLEISRIYQQPRYFRSADCEPYRPNSYPYSNLGTGWSLDLPWMDSNYVYLGGGMRFVIQWGNNGNPYQFENHDGVHFLMRGFSHGGEQYYELMTSSGVRYLFRASSLKLIRICDSQGYGDSNPLYALNWVDVEYDGGGNLYSLRDNAQRQITFSYDSYGGKLYLGRITRPDGNMISFGYTSYGASHRLTSTTDPDDRVTSYSYVAYDGCYLLDSVAFPSQSRNVYAYQLDSSVGTEVRAYLVTSQGTEDAVTHNLVRQTTYDYRVVCGRVVFTKVTQKNGAGSIQGFTDHIFSSRLKSANEISRDSSGAQLIRKDTWYDSVGQPVRIDTYEGASQTASHSEHRSHDDWGNVIYSCDPLGHETYASFANTKTQNTFQGGSSLTRTSSGKILHDAFDDWEVGDWSTVLDPGNSVTIDGADNPNAPAIKISHVAYGAAKAYHSFPAQTSDFVIQTSFMTSGGAPTYIEGKYGPGLERRFCFYSMSGSFYWWDEAGSHQIAEVACAYNTWYDIAFHVHYGTNSYEIFIDGEKVSLALTPNLVGTFGDIEFVLFQAGDMGTYPTYQWIDDARVYRNLTITITGASLYIAELYDAKGEMLDRSKNGNLSLAAPSLNLPSGYIKVLKEGYASFETPMMDIWGGDIYRFSQGESSSSLNKTTNGFMNRKFSIADNGYPGGTEYGSVVWVFDPGYAVNSDYYQQTPYSTRTSHHGFRDLVSQQGLVYPTDVLVQYIWLEEGTIPLEIMVQYYIETSWRRAYWGGNSDDEDIIATGEIDSYSHIHRVGDVPQVTGRWLQLVVNASDLGVSMTKPIWGVAWGLYRGAARWDFASVADKGVTVTGLTTGMTINLQLDTGQDISLVSAGWEVEFDTIAANAYPVSGTLRILVGGNLLYKAWLGGIYNRDTYRYTAPEYYPNEVEWRVHDRLVAALQYQDYSKAISQKTYLRLDAYGNVIQTKSSLGSGWVYAQAGYDQRGRQLWSTDQTGRATVTEYTIADNVYPKSTRSGWRMDTFDIDDSWTHSSDRSWMTSSYSTTRSYSPDRSIRASFSGAQADGQDYGNAWSWKEYAYSGNPTQELSVNLYLESWSHDGGSSSESMDAGIRMRLYDFGGLNYATYTYWLACWSGASNNRSAPDQFTKVVYGIGDLPTGTWKQVVLYPTTDWLGIDWTSCSKVRYEIYVSTSWAYADYLTLYYDNFIYNDFARNAKASYSWDTPTGNLLSITDPLTRTMSQQYDVLGRVIRMNNSDGSYRTTAYDDAANKVMMLDELGHKTVAYFDNVSRTTKVERWGNGTSAYSFVTYTYNWQDQVDSYTDERGHVTTYAYDYLGRPTRTTNPDLTYVTVAYDDANRLVTICSYTSGSVLTHKTVMVVDSIGRLNATREYTNETNHNETLMTYDAVGNLLTVRDANLQVTRMVYDSLDRLTGTTYPDLLLEAATYDDAGRTLTKTDREGNVTSSWYDTAGNLVKIISPSDTISKAYDAAGQLIQLKSGLGTITYAYDPRGRAWSLTEVIGSNSYEMRFGYDSEGRQTWLLYPSGLNVSYGYDSYDRVSTVTKQPSTPLLTLTYNPDDTISTETTGDGTKVTTYAFNNRDWPTSVVTKLSGTIKLVLLYSYDDVGSVRQLIVNKTGDPGSAQVEAYTYDLLDRLRSASGGDLPGGLTYEYDAVGNRIKMGSVNLTYSGYNWLVRDGTWTYSYDDSGNIVFKRKSTEQWSYEFNSLDQLVKVDKGTLAGKVWTWTTQGEYWYDANGMMAKSLQGGVATEYVYLGHDPLCEKTGTEYTDYVYANGRMVAKLTGSDICYYVKDALGSTRQVWKHGANNAAFSVLTYKPFGEPVGAEGTEKFEYAGEMLVGAAGSSPGLYYIGARWMDPELGRWYSLDPQLGSLSAPQTMNRYVYCANNPLVYVDPTGMFWETVFDIGCIIYDIYELQKNPTWGNAGWLALDVGCAIVPFVPALSPALKASKWFSKADDARKAADRGDDLSDIVRHVDDVPTPKPPVRQADDIDAILKGHLDDALRNWRYTPAQLDAMKSHPNLAAAFKGDRIHTVFLKSVRDDTRLHGLVKAADRFEAVPDVRYLHGSLWWDVTTQTQWKRHLSIYEDFGIGRGLFY